MEANRPQLSPRAGLAPGSLTNYTLRGSWCHLWPWGFQKLTGLGQIMVPLGNHVAATGAKLHRGHGRMRADVDDLAIWQAVKVHYLAHPLSINATNRAPVLIAASSGETANAAA